MVKDWSSPQRGQRMHPSRPGAESAVILGSSWNLQLGGDRVQLILESLDLSVETLNLLSNQFGRRASGKFLLQGADGLLELLDLEPEGLVSQIDLGVGRHFVLEQFLVDRAEDVVRGPRNIALLGVKFGPVVGGHEDDGGIASAFLLPELLGNLDAAQAGHPDIQKDDSEFAALGQLEGLPPAG